MADEIEQEGAPDTEIDSAIESAPVEEKPAPETPEEKPAEPEKEGPPTSALDAVRRAIDANRDRAEKAAAPEKEAEKETEPEQEEEEEQPADEKADKADILTHEEWQKLTPRAKKRIGKLTADVKAERAARESLEPRARMFDDMARYVQTTGMSSEQFENGLNIMGWLQTDPARAYEALKPIYAELQQHMGEMLPPDLQEQVDDGRITPELASQLVFERSQRSLLESQSVARQRAQEEFQAQQQAQQQHTQQRDTILKAINAWEATQKSSDPDYTRKAQAITDRATIMIQAEMPPDPAALIALMDRAKAMVDKQLPSARRQINPVNSSSAASTQARPVPKSPLEAVNLALAATARR